MHNVRGVNVAGLYRVEQAGSR